MRLALVSLLLATSGCAKTEAEWPSVLLVVVDTVSAERVGCYGAENGSTPNIDRLAAEGKRFERALAPAPWTQPSLASLFTSRMPSAHGVRVLLDVLPPEATTLAERLQARGYKTHGIVSNAVLRGQLGFAQGFETYNESAVAGHEGITSQKVTNQAIRWLDTKRREPFFLFVHYFDPHAVYNHHAAFDRTATYEGELRPGMDIWEARERRQDMSRADIDYLNGLHQEEIAFTDAHVGRLLDHLEASGLKERTLVVLTSDHGEEIMRHGWIGHTRTLHEELIRVPLVIRLPGEIAPGVVSTPVSLLDLLPTIMHLTGADPVPSWEGVSLLPLLNDRADDTGPRTFFAEVSFMPVARDPRRVAEKMAFKTAIVLGDLKLIHDELTDDWELYDVSTDPKGLNDIWGEDPERDALLRDRLMAWEAARTDPIDPHSPDGPIANDEALLEELRGLGYVR